MSQLQPGIAGLIKYSKNYDFKGQKIVCVVTGNGLKDPSTSEKHASSKIFEVDSNLDDVLKKLFIRGSVVCKIKIFDKFDAELEKLWTSLEVKAITLF